MRTRLLSLALAIVLPAVATGVLAVASAYEREQRSLEQALRETTRALALVVDREIALRQTVARSLSAAPSLADPDLSAFAIQADIATQEDVGWVVVSEHPAPGAPPRQVLNTSRPTGSPLPGGRGLAQFDAWNDPAPVVSDMFRGPISGDWVVAVTVPSSHSRKGSRLSVSVAMTPAQIQHVLEEQQLPPEWTAVVIDRAGRVVARQPNAGKWVGTLATDAMQARIAQGIEGLFETTTLEHTKVNTFISRSPRYGWTFAIGVPVAQQNQAIYRSMAWVITGIGLVVLIAIGLAVLAARRISAQVTHLSDAVRHLEGGQPPATRFSGIPELDSINDALVRAGGRMQQTNRLLEQRVADAVADAKAAYARLASSQRLEALGRLTGGVAHDVNNLLGVITNHAFVVQRLRQDERVDPSLQAIRRAVDNGRHLTQRLLAFAGRRTLNPEVIDLREWLSSAVSLSSASLPKDIHVDVVVSTHPMPIEVDTAELQIAILNLMLNARDAMPNGGQLTISAHPISSDESPLGVPSASITVADDGAGVAAEHLERVFEPFFTTKPVDKGTGLGLSQVYGFASRSGGHAGIDSAPGRGTTVTMTFPTTPKAVSIVRDSTPARWSGPSVRLLYVEDNEDLAASTLSALRSFGHDVTRVPDATRAMATLRTERFDLVLSDIVMPGGKSGIELARDLRATQPRLPVVLMTGYSSEATAASGAGFTVLQKPLTPETLDEVVRATSTAQGGQDTDRR